MSERDLAALISQDVQPSLREVGKYGELLRFPALISIATQASSLPMEAIAAGNSKDQHGQTPLSFATRNGHTVLAVILLARDGVDLDSTTQVG